MQAVRHANSFGSGEELRHPLGQAMAWSKSGSGYERRTVVSLSRISDKPGRSSARPQRNTKRGTTTFLADNLTVAERVGRPSLFWTFCPEIRCGRNGAH